MRLSQNVDIQRLLLTVDKCEGEVFIDFAEENSLNIKSMLSKVVLATLAEKKDKQMLKDAVIRCDIKSDEKKLQEFAEK